MSAANTDKLKKLSRRWVGQIGAGGVSDALVTTIPLSSTTNLPTDTAVVATIDRVDANGIATPSLEETVIGVVSGSNLISCLRGQEGTAQAHSAGAVVESLVTAQGWNDVVDWGLVEHNQDGTHKSSAVLPTSYLDTDGTLAANSDTKIASQKAVKTYADTKLSSSSTILTTGWIADANTWTYASADSPTFTLTVNADVTGFIGVGDRIKLTQTTVKYFIVTAISYGAPNTTITLYGGTDYTLANAAITLPNYSHVKNPLGFPANPTKWTVELSDTTDRQQTSPVSGTWYNLGSLSISVPIGVWNVNYIVEVESNRTTSGYFEQYLTLSTANNSESDVDFTTNCYGSATGATGTNFSLILFKSKVLSLVSKTAYYINAKTTQSSVTVLGLKNGNTKMFVRAVCAYL